MGGVWTGGLGRQLDTALAKARRQENSERLGNCAKVVNIWPEEFMG